VVRSRLREVADVVAAESLDAPALETVGSPTELAVALDALRGGRSYRDLERAARRLPDNRRLPVSTISDLLSRGTPSRETLDTYLATVGIRAERRTAWVAAWQRATTADPAAAAGSVRVDRVVASRLGIHSAITLPGVSDTDLPAYVERDWTLRSSESAPG
jgi:hypothetical protein